MRSDNILSSLGSRVNGARRLWVEDSFSRLSNNGFAPGSVFNVEPRQGPGVNLRSAILGGYTVSHRRGSAILSYENAVLGERFNEPEVRVKISVGLVQVLPSLRVFSVRSRSQETWRIGADGVLTTPCGSVALVTGRERISGRPDLIVADISASNLVAATDFIAWAKPREIRLTSVGATSTNPMSAQGELFDALSLPNEDALELSILTEVSKQFFVACGYTSEGTGVFVR